MPDSPWPTIHAERAALADDLTGLRAAQWATPTPCGGWTVHQVLAHQVATATTSPLRFLTRMAAAGFSFSGFAARGVAEESAGGPEQTLARFRRVLTSTTAPPGPRDTWLGEALVHAEDIRRPLGIGHAYPLPWVTRATEFYAGSNALIGGRRRVDGLRLQADDTDWSHGSGPVVHGPAVALLLATTGRSVGLDDLAGPGLGLLRARCPAPAA